MTETAPGLRRPALGPVAPPRSGLPPRRADRTTVRSEHALQQGDLGPTQDTVVEQAKGVLMLRYGIGSYESLATLAQWSHDAHVSLPELSRALVKGICQGHAGPRERGLVRWLEHRLREEVPGRDSTTRPATTPAPTAPAQEPVAEVRVPTAPAEEPAEEVRATSAVPDVAVVKRWRYASAVHAAKALHRG